LRNKYRRKRTPTKYYPLNYRIEAPTLRVIDSEGNQIGILPKEEALKKAREMEQDLILISPKAKPPVAKITDFKKFLYHEKKKAQEAKKGIKKSVVKDIKLSLFIAKADLERLQRKGKEFLEAGNQVSINLAMRGRENSKRQRAVEVVQNYIKELGDVTIAKEPRVMGRVVRAVVARKK